MGDQTADMAQAAVWQTGTAVVQAVCSVTLLAWYVLAAHLARSRQRREKTEDFKSLVRLCRDLGLEARDKTEAHLRDADALAEPAPASALHDQLAAWRADMTVIYVCLNEVPHYEVRNPAFSTALTRLWLEVDARHVRPEQLASGRDLTLFLRSKLDRICVEVDAMAGLLGRRPRLADERLFKLGAATGRRGLAYDLETADL